MTKSKITILSADLDGDPDFAPAVVLEQLSAMMSDARLQRFDQVLDQRLQSVRLVLDDLHDPHNIAAVLRSAEALGVQFVDILELGQRMRVGRKPARSSERWLSLRWHQRAAHGLGELAVQGYEIWGADVGPGSVDIAEIPNDRPVAIVMGSEKRGLGKMTKRYLDGRFRVPMFGFVESFNVSVATALALSQVCGRRRDFLQQPGDLSEANRQALRTQWILRSVREPKRVAQALQRRPQEPQGGPRNLP